MNFATKLYPNSGINDVTPAVANLVSVIVSICVIVIVSVIVSILCSIFYIKMKNKLLKWDSNPLYYTANIQANSNST